MIHNLYRNALQSNSTNTKKEIKKNAPKINGYEKFFKYIDVRPKTTLFAIKNDLVTEPLYVNDYMTEGHYIHTENTNPKSVSGKTLVLKKFKIITYENTLIYLLK